MHDTSKEDARYAELKKEILGLKIKQSSMLLLFTKYIEKLDPSFDINQFTADIEKSVDDIMKDPIVQNEIKEVEAL